MELIERYLDGLLLIRPKVFGDHRGYFFESFNERRFAEVTGQVVRFVQDNESRSARGVLRGLHIQARPHTQAKLVRVVSGAVLDVCVDVRPDSPTRGRHVKVRLDAEDKTMLYVPPGFAHGFLTLEDGTVFTYKCSNYYEPASERTLLWNDPELGIDWEVAEPALSDKDRVGTPLADLSW